MYQINAFLYHTYLVVFRLFIPREEKATLSPHLPFKIYLCIKPRSFSLTEVIYTYKGSGPYTGAISLLVTPMYM